MSRTAQNVPVAGYAACGPQHVGQAQGTFPRSTSLRSAGVTRRARAWQRAGRGMHSLAPGARGLWVLAAALAASACTGSLLETAMPVSTSYVLAAAPAAPAAIEAVPVHLAIGRPDMAPGLDTDRIAVLQGQRLDYFRAARWGGGSAAVVQTLLVDSLQDQRLFRSVTAEQARVASDYVLDVTVRDFQAEYTAETAAPEVNLTLTARLIRVVDRRLAGTFVSRVRSRAEANRMQAVAAAFQSAAHQAVLDLARQTAAAVAGDAGNLRAARGEAEAEPPDEGKASRGR